MADIFISYDNEDRDRVVPIVAALENRGWSTFWDWKSIPVAKTWRQFIKEGLEQARCVLVLWSGKSIDSEWVIEEADHGKANRRLIPAMIDDVPPPIGFGQIQAAKLIHWTGDVNNAEFKKLVDAIESILGPSPRRVREAGGEEKELIKREKEKEANRARLEKAERAAEPPAPTLSVPAAGETSKIETMQGEPQPKETDKPFLPQKRPTAQIGIWIALVVMLAIGAVLLFRQDDRREPEPTPQKPTPMSQESDAKAQGLQDDHKKAQPIVRNPKLDLRASGTKAAAPATSKPKSTLEIKPSNESPQESFTNSIGMQFVLVPVGSFNMGGNTDKPSHEVMISRPFFLQTTEVTHGQWKKLMGDNTSDFKQCGDDCPVESVSWEDAQRFIEKLNQLEKTEGYRLPSEAEWEYACRAGTNTKYFFGNDARLLGHYAWYYDNSNKTTHQVASRKPNAWGLYDMYGNLSEWVEDDWHSSYEGAPTDGKAWIDNTRNSNTIRTLRGCNWKSVNYECKSSHRDMYLPTARRVDVGFRLAKSP